MTTNESNADQYKKIEVLMTQAVRAQQHAKYAQAQALYKEIIKLDPSSVAAFHLLGLTELQLGHFERAVACIREAIRQNPKNAAFYSSLGMVLRASGRIPEAKEAFIKALSLNAKNVEVLNALGAIHLFEKDFESAEKFLKNALEIKKDYLDIHINLGNLALMKSEPQLAEESFRKALQINPRSAQAHFGLAKTYQTQTILRKAVTELEIALTHDPNLMPARLVLAEVYEKIQRYEEAEVQLLKIIEKQQDAGIFVRIGRLAMKKQDETKALAAYKKAIDLENDNVQAFIEVGKIYYKQNKLKQAIACLFRATQLSSTEKEAFYYLGLSLTRIHKWREAIAAFDEASKAAPENAAILGELLDAALHNGDFSHAETASQKLLSLYEDIDYISPEPLHPQLSLHVQSSIQWQVRVAKDYAKKIEDRLSRFQYEHGRSKKEIINLGYISSYFGDKYAGLLVRDILVHHNRKRFKVFLYNTHPNPDQETFAGYGIPGEDTLRNLHDLTDRAAAERIYKDGVHILIDIGGPTRTARLDILAYQPAPVQCLMLGYPSTSGASFYQYFITSKSVVTSEEAKLFTEKVLYLPDTSFATRGFFTPDVFLLRSLFKLPHDAIVLCNFQRAYHLDKKTFEVWAEILNLTENTILWLESDEVQFQENVLNFLEEKGIASERIIFTAPEPLTQRALYTLADIMLESIMVPARVHTVMALWSGLPVVAMMGSLPQSRVAAGFVQSANSHETLAKNEKQYIDIAVNLCKNKEVLQNLRTRLLKARSISSLFNPVKFMLSLDDAIRDIWESYNK